MAGVKQIVGQRDGLNIQDKWLLKTLDKHLTGEQRSSRV